MSIVESLMNSAMADVDTLRSLDAHGDIFEKFRDVDFLLRTQSSEKATLAADFINEYKYGTAKVKDINNGHTIEVTVNMPITQSVILSVSGFMNCIAELYGLEFDGWGCIAQKSKQLNQ